MTNHIKFLSKFEQSLVQNRPRCACVRVLCVDWMGWQARSLKWVIYPSKGYINVCMKKFMMSMISNPSMKTEIHSKNAAKKKQKPKPSFTIRILRHPPSSGNNRLHVGPMRGHSHILFIRKAPWISTHSPGWDGKTCHMIKQCPSQIEDHHAQTYAYMMLGLYYTPCTP